MTGGRQDGERAAAFKRLAAAQLKRCPLCGTMNSSVNSECFVCLWSGRFDTDPMSISEGLDDLLAQSPELAQSVYVPEREPSIWHRICCHVTNWFRR